MAVPSVPRTFSNNESVGRAPYHNENHTAWKNFLTDGTADLTVGSINIASSITYPGYSIRPFNYDEVVPTYTSNLLSSVVYKLASVTQETLTIVHDSSNRPSTVTDSSGNVWTFTHAGTGFLSGVVKT
jgi:uncharacterized protein RhaS with RHS repeats